MSKTAEPCMHQRVYSGEFLTSIPPQYFWACPLCGAHGREHRQTAPAPESIVGKTSLETISIGPDLGIA